MDLVTVGPLALTSTEPSGVEWLLTDFKGWGAPGGTLAPVKKPRAPGTWSGKSYSQARPMVATGACFAPDATLAADALDRLIDACSLDETLLTVAEPARARWCMARRDGEVIPTWLGDDAFEYSVQFAADDPRKLGAALTGSTGLPSSSGGFTFPHVFPFSIASTVVSGQVNLFNPGNETGPVMLRIDGPCTGPIVTHVGSGLALVFSASLTLGAGEFLIVDMEGHKALAQGQANRSNWILSRGWSGLEPGNNTFAFSAASGTTGLLTVVATPADQ